MRRLSVPAPPSAERGGVGWMEWLRGPRAATGGYVCVGGVDGVVAALRKDPASVWRLRRRDPSLWRDAEARRAAPGSRRGQQGRA
eukprot:gene16215-55423_t